MISNGTSVSKGARITGWILSILPCLMFIGGGVMALIQGDKMAADVEKMGWTVQHMQKLAIVEIVCAILYLIPQTSVLGAILLTAYLGGAVATHVRINDPLWFVPVIFGIVIWLGLFLREPRVRALVPLKH